MDLSLGEVQKTSLPPHCSSWEPAVFVALGGLLPQGQEMTTTGICSCNYENCYQKQTVGQALEGWYK